MIEQLPIYISIVFGLTTLTTFGLTYRAIIRTASQKNTYIISSILGLWLLIQMVISINLYYVDTVGSIPPLFPIIGFLPAIIAIVVLFNHKTGKQFIDRLSIKDLTWISIVRIPVELVLWSLFVHDMIPELMTFEGRNFDILAGITAPFVILFGIKNGQINSKIFLIWNILSLALLLNIIGNAFLSFPTFFQQFGLNQPNWGILYFPFFWLPSFIVPVVIFTHVASIRQLLYKK